MASLSKKQILEAYISIPHVTLNNPVFKKQVFPQISKKEYKVSRNIQKRHKSEMNNNSLQIISKTNGFMKQDKNSINIVQLNLPHSSTQSESVDLQYFVNYPGNCNNQTSLSIE